MRFTGIALPSGTAAKLIVYTARIVALGAQNKQAARLANLIGFVFNLLFVFVFKLLEFCPCLKDFFILGFGKAFASAISSSGYCSFFISAVAKNSALPAKHNVGSASRHVGGDGYGAELACLRNYFSLALVILCVEHIVLYAFLFKHF